MSAVPPPPPGSGGPSGDQPPPPPPGDRVPTAQHAASGSTGQHTATESQHAQMDCPQCGAPLRADQDWCLSCGAAVTTQIAGSRGWRVPVAIASVVLLLAAGALVFAFARLTNDADVRAAATPVPTAAPTTDPAAPPVPGETPVPGLTPTPEGIPAPTATPVVPGTTPAPVPTPVPGATPPPTDTPGLPDFGGGTDSGADGEFEPWPAGEDGFTVILFSGDTRSQAESRARGYRSGGTDVGILNSGNFSSLRSGFWVVFSGQYDSLSAAQDAAEGLQGTEPSAYAREITR